MQQWISLCRRISVQIRGKERQRTGADQRCLRVVVIFSLITMIGIIMITSCISTDTVDTQSGQSDMKLAVVHTKVQPDTPTIGNTPTPSATKPPPPPTPTMLPTMTQAPSPTFSPTEMPAPTPTPTPIGPCAERMPEESLYTLVNADYGLSRYYAPPDLVALSDYLPNSVTLGYPTMLRRIVIPSLVQMIGEMQAAGLNPTIISGYRSYSTQQAAWLKWSEQYPDRVSIISAEPGHSEHQLGTTVDFGSPELPEIVGEEDIQFHTSFYLTSEAIWLDQHAHEFGFHLSFPRNSIEDTGMFYEPWHYRYLGTELASRLKRASMTFTRYALMNLPVPCNP